MLDRLASPLQGLRLPQVPAGLRVALWCIVGLAAFWVGSQWLQDWVVFLGVHIPQPDVQLDYLKGMGLAILIGLSILFWPVSAEERAALMVVWLVKVFVVLGFMLFYEHKFGEELDSFQYYRYGTELQEWAAWRSNALIYNVCAMTNWLVPNSFHSLKIAFALVGFLSIYVIYRAVCIASGRCDVRIFYLLALFPSIVFWSAIVGKDPIVLAGLALYFLGAVGWERRHEGGYIVAMTAGMFAVMLIRPWMVLVMLLPAPCLFLSGAARRSPLAALVFLVLAVVGVQAGASYFVQTYNISDVNDLSQAADTVRSNFAGDYTEGSDDGRGIVALVAGMFTALFRPLPGEVPNAFGLITGLENLLLLGFFVGALARKEWTRWREPLVMWAIVFVLLWSACYSGVALGNFGALVRFKLQVLPLIICLLLYFHRGRPVPAGPK